MTLVARTLDRILLDGLPVRLVADRAYDSDPLRRQMGAAGIELIVPHRRNRSKPPMNDGRKLRRYRKRWKMERFFAWLHNYRRCVVRYDRHNRNFEGFVLMATACIYLKKYF